MIKAVIFDLDGVLVHTDQYHYAAWKLLACELGIPFNESLNRRLRGLSRMDSLTEILRNASRQYSDAEKDRLAEKKNNVYKALIARMSPTDVDRSVLCTLEALRRQGLRLGVGSSSQNARFILERTGLYPYFDAAADGTMIVHAKPNPEVFLKAATLLAVIPSETAVVEDAHSGIEAAKAGGFVAIAVGDAVSSRLADAVLTQFSDLPKCLTYF